MRLGVMIGADGANNTLDDVIGVAKNVEAAKERIARNLTIYGQLPSYRAMLDREGVDGPADIASVKG